ncbi:MAG TPA: chemotaxis protein CheA [Terriglobia bacterium]|nr:chemotaxis protein CheA [Terriglobia bacterium]
MSTTGKSFFDQFLDDYFAESEEHLTSARNLMLSIESSGANKPVDANVLDELLRNFHSLKGLSAMVGLEEATLLAHHIEDYLRELKRPDTAVSPDGIEHVMAGITAIEQVVEAKRKLEPLPDISLVVLQLDSATEEVRTKPLASAKSETGMWRFIFRSSPELASKGMTVNAVRDRLRHIGEILRASPQILRDGQVAFEFLVAAEVPETAFGDLGAQGIEYAPAIEDSIMRAPRQTEASPDAPAARVAPLNVIRVEMNRLDDLMRFVGDLVISRFRLDEALRTAAHGSVDWSALQEINTSMERQLRELREGVVRIRMVPIGQVFEKMRFVVRGLERELNKRIEVHIEGQDTEIDKVIVERMMDPLLHLVRNAISHGLESPEERAAAGKPATGIVRLSAITAGDTVVIQVEDDGRGIDVAKIADRARTLGWLGSDQFLDSKRLLDIISAPGFTTRDEADLASGRGVGMAAVQTVISELGGSMTLTTTEGQGTRFTVNLPLTLLIADSLMVTVSRQRFAVPQTAVREVLAIDASSVRVFENNEVVPFRGGVLPLLRLSRFFGLSEPALDRLHLLVIADGDSRTGLAVDRITGQREIVVRTITDPLLRVPGVVGATELGDGRPVLILDPHSLIRAARDRNSMEIPS